MNAPKPFGNSCFPFYCILDDYECKDNDWVDEEDDSSSDEDDWYDEEIEKTKPICVNFRIAFHFVGETFAKFCEKLKDEIENLKLCQSKLTSGPLHKDLNLRSIIAKAYNNNNFPVRVKIIINSIDSGINPFYCEEKTIPGCSYLEFSTIDMTTFNLTGYIVDWEFTKLSGKPVYEKVYVYSAGRSDLPTVPLQNSHLIPANTLNHSQNFTKL